MDLNVSYCKTAPCNKECITIPHMLSTYNEIFYLLIIVAPKGFMAMFSHGTKMSVNVPVRHAKMLLIFGNVGESSKKWKINFLNTGLEYSKSTWINILNVICMNRMEMICLFLCLFFHIVPTNSLLISYDMGGPNIILFDWHDI